MSETKSLNTNRDLTKAQAVKVAEQMAAAVEDRTADNEFGIKSAV
jgi:hypothetical protein